MTGVPVEYFDERYTTSEADELLGSAKLTKKQRQARRDQLAAQIMLTAYLEAGGRGQDIAGRHRMTKLIFGCGYLGERVARRWRDAGDDVVVVTRSGERAEGVSSKPATSAIVADVTQPATLANLPSAETVLFAVGFDRSAGGSIEEVYAGGMQNVLAALPSDVGRFIYISTTGVYGNAGGEWVDEDTPPDPQRDGGRASLAAEASARRKSVRRSRHRLAARRDLRPGADSVSRQAARRRTDPGGERGLSQSHSRRRCGGGRRGGRRCS